MKKVFAGVVMMVVVLAAAGAYAGWGGHGPGYAAAGVNVENLKKFQKETLTLRDELMTKELDLENEYAKSEPDARRIATLRKDIIDIEAKVQTVAEKHGLRSPGYGPGGRGMRGRGMMAGGPGSYGCGKCNW